MPGMVGLSGIGLQLVPANVSLDGVAVALVGTGVNLPNKGINIRPGGLIILLSNATVPSNAPIGTVVGVLSVIGGTGSYTFTLVNNPGTLFSISGSSLQVAAALSPGSDSISIKADNGAGSTATQPFLITITSPSTNGPMDFSVPGNIGITAAIP